MHDHLNVKLKILFVQSDTDSNLCLWCGLFSGVRSFRRGIESAMVCKINRQEATARRNMKNIQR